MGKSARVQTAPGMAHHHLEIVRRLARSRKAGLSMVFAGTAVLVTLNLLDDKQFVLSHPRNSDFFLWKVKSEAEYQEEARTSDRDQAGRLVPQKLEKAA